MTLVHEIDIVTTNHFKCSVDIIKLTDLIKASYAFNCVHV